MRHLDKLFSGLGEVFCNENPTVLDRIIKYPALVAANIAVLGALPAIEKTAYSSLGVSEDYAAMGAAMGYGCGLVGAFLSACNTVADHMVEPALAPGGREALLAMALLASAGNVGGQVVYATGAAINATHSALTAPVSPNP